MLFWSRAISASGSGSREIAFPAVPMTVDSVKAPARSPAAVPQSYPKAFAAATVVARLTTHSTSVSSACAAAFLFSARKNCGPTL
jgi:hypothetical protein